MVWYDWMKPSHAQLHSDYMQPLTEAKARSKNKGSLGEDLESCRGPSSVLQNKLTSCFLGSDMRILGLEISLHGFRELKDLAVSAGARIPVLKGQPGVNL